jgi:hypothetical protein
MHPEGDRSLVLEAAAYLKANATPSRDERNKLVAPSDFFDAGLDRMRRFASGLASDLNSTMGYQGGLMMTVTIAKPLRRRILVELLVGSNLIRTADGGYVLKLRDGKTRTAAEADAVLPTSLSEFIDRWLYQGRTFLLRGRSSAALWLMPDGTDMTAPAFYHRFCQATGEEFRNAINPHFVRKISATGISVFQPQLVEIIQHVLDHGNDEMRKQYYDLADRLVASRRYLDLLGERRRRAIESLLDGEAAES